MMLLSMDLAALIGFGCALIPQLRLPVLVFLALCLVKDLFRYLRGKGKRQFAQKRSRSDVDGKPSSGVDRA